jgi:hypothetical protein
LFLRALKERGVFHLWGHSWEIEQQNQWRKLEELLAVIAGHRENLRFVPNGELDGLSFPVSASESAPFSERRKFAERA